MMKVYKSLRPLIVYKNQNVSLPVGKDRVGHGNAVFLVSPNRETALNVISKGLINTNKGLYRKYSIDFIYKDKIGLKKVSKNNGGAFRKEIAESPLPNNLTLVSNNNRASVINKKSNLIVNLGEWMNIYFKFQLKGSLEKICQNFFNFLSKRMSESLMENTSVDTETYDKLLCIDVDSWLTATKKLGLNRENLNNPIAILLVALYKFPEKLSVLMDTEILLISSNSNAFMRITMDDLVQKNYTKIKKRITEMVSKDKIDESCMDEKTAIDQNPVESKPLDEMNTKEIIAKMSEKEKIKMEEVREKILNSLIRNLIHPIEDITDPDDNSEIKVDDDDVNEIKEIANRYLNDHPELLKSGDIATAENEIQKELKKRYIREYAPKYTDKQLKVIKELQGKQDATIGSLESSIEDLQSKVIDKSDFSNVVDISNPNLLESKFVNFERSYNSKKLEKDIDQAVGMFANASKKVFVVDKKVEDTSTPVNLKKTYTYILKDEKEREMKLVFDVPIIFDDHFMLLNGNKKVIQHTFVLKPIVKTGVDTVQIVSNYQKMFIMRKGTVDLKTNALFRHLNANVKEYHVQAGNGVITNKKYKSTLEYDGIAKRIVQFTVNNHTFILDTVIIDDMIKNGKIDTKGIDFTTQIIIGIDDKNKPMVMSINESFVDRVMSVMPTDAVEDIMKRGKKSNAGRLLMYSETKPLNSKIPLILLLLYFEGFSTVMQKAGIEYELIKKDDFNPKDINLFEWGITEMEDGYIKWKRYPTENSLLMNGLNPLPMHLYSIEELDSRDTYMYMISNFYKFVNQAFNLDQYYDFMIDPITREILTDMHLPTDLVSLCLLANKMLKVNESANESHMQNVRVRSNEIIPYHVYKQVTDAYRNYRKTQHRKRPQAISIKQDAILRSLAKQPASAMNDASSLNPILEISKLRAITYKGENGTNMDHTFTLDVRAYNESMLGVLGITTSADSGVGINRQLALEPNITSTRGYIDVQGSDHVEEMNSAQLLAPSELLTPLGVQHDDPTRTSMSYKQTMYMLMTDQSDPALIGNGAEKILPYHISDEFAVNAQEDGQVIEKDDEFMVIKYKNGKYRTLDLTKQIRKNSSAGFYIPVQLVTNLKAGQKFKKNEIIAWEDRAFRKTGNDPDVAMRLGPLVKVAILPAWDIYEDSAPVSRKASTAMTAPMVMPIDVVLDKSAYVSKICKVGDKVNAGDAVMVFDNYHEDEDVLAMIQSLRADLKEDVIESTYSRKITHYTGEIVSIDIVTTVPVEELSESLQKIVKDNWKKLKRRDYLVNKYSNKDDMNYYKSGMLLTETTDPVETDYQGKVKGKVVNEGVIITFYIEFHDTLARGDKIAAEFALKSVTSHVIDDGLEPYAESDPDEPIDLITAPLSVSARKTPSIFIAMFGNKILIKEFQKLKKWWNEN